MINGATVCLCMIVRNESKVIARSLRSAIKLGIDYAFISDTGSTDYTLDRVSDALSGIVQFDTSEDTWINFAANRNLAILKAKQRFNPDYLLIIDADEEIDSQSQYPEAFTADVYSANLQCGSYNYARPFLISTKKNWYYRGVVHEGLFCDEPHRSVDWPRVTVYAYPDGARSRNPNKYLLDAELLLEEVKKYNRPRDIFYLAQSYKDACKYQEAISWYALRAQRTDGWEEESWYSLYQIGLLQAAIGMRWNEISQSLLAAYQYRPSRLEPLYFLAKYYRENQSYALGYLYASPILEPRKLTDRLFINTPIYNYMLRTEMAWCANGLGRQEEARRIILPLLSNPNLPEIAHIQARAFFEGIGVMQ